MASHNGQKCSRIFHQVEIFFSSREFFSESKFFYGVENYFFESNSDNYSRRFYPRVEIFFFWVENYFIESRTPDMPCCHLPPKRSNDMAVCRSVGYVAFLYIAVVLQVDDGNVEDLERFLLSIQDCISYIERCSRPLLSIIACHTTYRVGIYSCKTFKPLAVFFFFFFFFLLIYLFSALRES